MFLEKFRKTFLRYQNRNFRSKIVYVFRISICLLHENTTTRDFTFYQITTVTVHIIFFQDGVSGRGASSLTLQIHNNIPTNAVFRIVKGVCH